MGFPNEGTQFPVILSDLLKSEDRATLLATLAEFKTGAQARAQANGKGFAVEVLDPRGRCILLKWRGADVALLYQRSITMVTVLPQESVNAKIKSPDEAWVMVNLVNMRHDQELAALRTRVQTAEQTSTSATGLLSSLQRECEQKGLALDDHVKLVADLQVELKQYKEAVRVLEKGGAPVIYKVRPKEKAPVDKKRGPTRNTNFHPVPAVTTAKKKVTPPPPKKKSAKKAPVKTKVKPKKKKK